VGGRLCHRRKAPRDRQWEKPHAIATPRPNAPQNSGNRTQAAGKRKRKKDAISNAGRTFRQHPGHQKTARLMPEAHHIKTRQKPPTKGQDKKNRYSSGCSCPKTTPTSRNSHDAVHAHRQKKKGPHCALPTTGTERNPQRRGRRDGRVKPRMTSKKGLQKKKNTHSHR